MHSIIRFRFVTLGIALSGLAAAGVDAQVRRAQPGRSQVQVTIELKIGPDALKAAGSGACTHAPQASIYDLRAQLRAVRFAVSGQSVQLSFWDPLDGSEDMFTLAASTGTNARSVSTVRGGNAKGSGTAVFEPAGKGGTFRIDARTADGIPIAGTIKCDAFTPHMAEGG
jgi:hypothetical protein